MADDKSTDQNSVQELLNTGVYPALYHPFQKLSEFLKRQRDLFTLIGVFGAITIYARTAIQSSNSLSNEFSVYAIGAGFSTIILLSFLILTHLWVEIRKADTIISIENWGLIVFASFFAPLTGILAILISQYGSFWSPYVVFVLLLTGVLIPVLVVFSIGILAREMSQSKLDIRPEYPEYLSMGISSLLIFYYMALRIETPTLPGSVADYILFDWINLLISFIQLTSFIALPLLALLFSSLAVYLAINDLHEDLQGYLEDRRQLDNE